jgi:hypothetical protein
MILRQLQAIRGAMLGVALFMFIATAAIIFSRPDITDVDLSFILTLPFLAALGVLPIGAPAFLVFLEVFGTARILVAVHPHSTVHVTRSPSSISAEKSGKVAKKEKLLLLARYFLATTLSRLSLKEWARSIRLYFRSVVGRQENSNIKSDFQIPKILRVPPASVYLLEKLGVATAFTLVDDELACEPHALPQQLLIPSGKGLKLLDMCPIFEEESDGDESLASARRRAKSFDTHDHHDSDTDSDTPAFSQVVARTRKKTKNIFHLRRKRGQSSIHSPVHAHGDPTTHALPVESYVQFEGKSCYLLPLFDTVRCLYRNKSSQQIFTFRSDLVAAPPGTEGEIA